MDDGPRVGIFGGAFDPPHVGHVAVARAAAEGASLDRVLWVPAAVPPHKVGKVFAPAEARRRMVEAAIRDHPGFELCDLELRRGGVSYTVDTLRALKAARPDWRLFLIVGADVLSEFGSWKEPEAILETAALVVVPRNGAAPVETGAVPAGPTASVRRSANLRFEPHVVPMPRVDVSSEEVRRRVVSPRERVRERALEVFERAKEAHNRTKKKKSHRDMLPPRVMAIIEKEGLYGRRTAGFGRDGVPHRHRVSQLDQVSHRDRASHLHQVPQRRTLSSTRGLRSAE